MKYLIVGLGNPGGEYEHTRHNIGWDIIDELAEGSITEFESKRYGCVNNLRYRGRTLILLKPTTFMNLSGNAVRYWLKKERIPLDNLIVILDDVDLEFGRIRMKKKGSGGSHNGLNNIIESLNTEKFNRIRFGIGNDFSRGQKVDFVLSKFTDEEMEILKTRKKVAADAVKSFVIEGMDIAMNKFNNK
ncbi:MAG: aminoacyl-tRNA hydrolase [Bacteroidales bacterium]